MTLLTQQHLILELMLIPTWHRVPMGFALHRMAHRLIAPLLARFTVYATREILFGKRIDRSLVDGSREFQIQRFDRLVDDSGPTRRSYRSVQHFLVQSHLNGIVVGGWPDGLDADVSNNVMEWWNQFYCVFNIYNVDIVHTLVS